MRQYTVPLPSRSLSSAHARPIGLEVCNDDSKGHVLQAVTRQAMSALRRARFWVKRHLLALPGMAPLGGGVPAKAGASWVGAVGAEDSLTANEVKIAAGAQALCQYAKRGN